MDTLERYKIVEITTQHYNVKNRFYVYQLCAVNKQGKPTYRLVRQCGSQDKAQEYVASKTAPE